MANVQGTSSLSSALKKLYQLLIVERKDIYAIYALAILAGLLQLSVPLGIQSIISFVQAGSYSASIVVLIVFVVAGVLITGFIQIRQMQISEKIEQKIFTRYSFQFASVLPRINIQKMDNYYLPEVVNRFFDVINLQKGFAKLLLDIPAAFIQMAFGLLLLSFYHPVFILFGILLFTVLLLIIRFTSVKGMNTNMEASNYKYSVASWLEEMARTIKTFKYSKGTSLHMKHTDELTNGYLSARTAHFKILQIQYWSLVSFKVLITAAMLIVGSVLLVDQQINIGQFVAAEIVILAVIASVEKFIFSIDKIYDVLTALEKLDKIAGCETETDGTLDLPQKKEGVKIEFNNVSFSYPGDANVLSHISFSIQPGEHVAIMGNSGSGKSTILRLLTGAFKNFEGSVLVDNVPSCNYTLQSLRAQTGIILSRQDIFKASIIDNITMGNPDISIQEVTEMAQITGLSRFIAAQTAGYDTMLDPAGKRLPKKITQSILLMRALTGNHRMLLLEDPCNHIDRDDVSRIISFLRNDTNATIIMATNDEDLAAVCDQVILIDNGSIKATGPWQQIKGLIKIKNEE